MYTDFLFSFFKQIQTFNFNLVKTLLMTLIITIINLVYIINYLINLLFMEDVSGTTFVRHFFDHFSKSEINLWINSPYNYYE